MARIGMYKREPKITRQRCHGCCHGKFRDGVDYDPETGLQLCLDCRFPEKRNSRATPSLNGNKHRALPPETELKRLGLFYEKFVIRAAHQDVFE